MPGFSTEAKVGVFVLSGLAVLAYMTIRLGSLTLGQPESYQVWAVFEHATGLKKNAPVEMAGIPVGSVKEIALYKGKAKITFLINKQVVLPSDSAAFVRTRGVLGDKYIALEMGSPGAPPLKDGERLSKAQVPTDLDRVMSRIGDIAEDVKDITSSLRVSLASPQSQKNISDALANIRELSQNLKVLVADNQMRLNQVVANMERFTADLSEISGSNKQALNETILSFHRMSGQLEQTISKVTPQLEGTIAGLSSVVGKIDKGQGSIGALVNERQTIDDLNATLASLKEVARKIEQGKGTIGKLVNDDTTVTKIDEALTGINDFLTKADDWRVRLDYRAEYLFDEPGLRSILNLRLQPKADKFFLLGVMYDPMGKREEKDITTTFTRDGGSYTIHEREVTLNKDEILFNAQIGKRIRDITLRAGVFASSGGIGLDYHWNDNLTFTMDAYDFRFDFGDRPHLKFGMDYSFWKYFYLTAGWDNFLNGENDSFFAGIGITFWDEDIKFLLTSGAVPKP